MVARLHRSLSRIFEQFSMDNERLDLQGDIHVGSGLPSIVFMTVLSLSLFPVVAVKVRCYSALFSYGIFKHFHLFSYL
jgi:hypothetical protein